MALQVWLHGKDLINRGLCPNNASWVGSATYVDGKLGKCYSCTSSHYIDYTYNFASTNKFTIAFWIYIPTSLSTCNQWELVFCFQNYIIDWASYNNLKIYDNSNNQLWWLGGDIFYDKWVHLTIAHNVDTITLYINGDHYSTANSVSSPISSGTMHVGYGITDAHGPVKFNDIRLYDHCLSPKEVKEIAKGLVLHYPLNDAYIEGTNNLFTYPTPGSSCTNSYKWDKTLHKDAISVSGWSSGYNGGVGNHSTVYHAHWIMMNGLPTMRFPYITNSLGQTPEWLGIRGRFRLQPSDFISGIKYTVSFDAKADENNSAISCGLYYKRNSSENWNFYDGNRTTTLTTDWKRYSVTYTSQGAYEISSFYFYGVCSGPNGNRYVRNVQLEIKNHATPYTPNTRNETTVYDCSGYQNNGTITGSLSCSTDSPRYKTCVQTSSSGKIQKDIILPSAITHYTISVWCKITDPNAAANLWTKHSNGVKGIIQGPDGGWIYSYNGGGLITRTSFLTTSGTITQTYPGFGQNCKDGNWHMYTIVGNGNINTCYLDGVMTGRSTLSNFVSYNINGQLNIGLTEECLVSDYRVYATALSEEDIKELYNTSAYVLDNGTLLTYSVEE